MKPSRNLENSNKRFIKIIFIWKVWSDLLILLQIKAFRNSMSKNHKRNWNCDQNDYIIKAMSANLIAVKIYEDSWQTFNYSVPPDHSIDMNENSKLGKYPGSLLASCEIYGKHRKSDENELGIWRCFETVHPMALLGIC